MSYVNLLRSRRTLKIAQEVPFVRTHWLEYTGGTGPRDSGNRLISIAIDFSFVSAF